MKTKKIIIAVAAVLGIIYLVKKAKKGGNTSGGPIPPPLPVNEIGSNATNMKSAQMTFQEPGAPGNRTIVWRDTTRRRCIDDQGRTYYTDGPCAR